VRAALALVTDAGGVPASVAVTRAARALAALAW
jgi:hypothetical protein